MVNYYHWLSLVVLLAIAIQSWMMVKKPRDLPPGPLRLPIIGNLHNLGKKPHQSLAKLAKIHGPLMSLQLGSLTSVVVSSPWLAQQVLQKHDLVFSNRWVPDFSCGGGRNDFSIAYLPINNLACRNLRKICNSQLLSNKSLDGSQHLRQKKVEELISNLHGFCRAGAAVNISQQVFSSTLSLLSNTIFSLDIEDPDSAFCRELKESLSQIVSLAGQPNIGDYFPLLKGLDLQRIRRRADENYTKLFALFQILIDERLAKGIDHTAETNTDVLDALLEINQDNKEELGMSYVLQLLADLFAAGTDTTSITMEWAMAELLRDQSKLKKAQAELDLIIGKGNPVKEGDITRLPYLQAVIKETFRMHMPGPLLIPRVASSDVNLCGYRVPKDTQVLINVWAIGRDPSVWERPCSFEPERFLGSEIDVRGLHFELLPFGSGRRICPGMLLGLRTLYLTLGSLIHSFDWKLEDGVEPSAIDMEEKFGISIHKATPFCAIPVSRI